MGKNILRFVFLRIPFDKNCNNFFKRSMIRNIFIQEILAEKEIILYDIHVRDVIKNILLGSKI